MGPSGHERSALQTSMSRIVQWRMLLPLDDRLPRSALRGNGGSRAPISEPRSSTDRWRARLGYTSMPCPSEPKHVRGLRRKRSELGGSMRLHLSMSRTCSWTSIWIGISALLSGAVERQEVLYFRIWRTRLDPGLQELD